MPTTMRLWRCVLAGILLLPPAAACGHDKPTAPMGTRTVQLDDRPFHLYVPTVLPTHPVPLVVGLHSYSSNSTQLADYFGLIDQAQQRGFLLALPDGTVDSSGEQFWNATDACCNFGGSKVDDSTYLSQLIDAVKASYPVDATRVYLIGHSNGGFMAHRMACDHADQIAAIVSLAGAVWNDQSRCRPSRPISVLQIHGTSDTTIRYAGGANGGSAGGTYPGAEQTFATWRSLDGCAADVTTTVHALDLDASLPGAETDILAAHGCRDGVQVQLWRMAGGVHVPTISATFTPVVLDFLFAQRPPAA
jgi:polyhydroxybutyrate depolymerase